jgi:hypothetical protein
MITTHFSEYKEKHISKDITGFKSSLSIIGNFKSTNYQREDAGIKTIAIESEFDVPEEGEILEVLLIS